jgi:hypothetical protein
MTLIYGEEKPNLEELAHYGVIGMKWGKHRVKANAAQIRSARRRLGKEQEALFEKQDNVKSLQKGSAARIKGEKELAKQTTAFLKNPDRVTATRLTRGEKAVFLILGGPVGVAGIAATSAVSRRIEKKQDDKRYDKK